jgi:single-strand DNA-binding protein
MLNKVTLIGNLGADPELRHMPNGGAVVNVTIATTMRWKDKASFEKKEETEWHRVIFFNRQAEIAEEYLKKGSKIYVEGRLKTRKWSKDGVDMYTTEVIATELHMLDSKPSGSGTGNVGHDSGKYQSAQTTKQGRPQQSSAPATDYDDFDDDIPF